MIAKFCSLEWKKSDIEFVLRKLGEKKPTTTCKEYKRNTDGSIVYMVTKANEYVLTITAENGQKFSEDVYGVIKYYNHNVRITKNFRIKFENFMRTRNYTVDNNGFIRGIYDSVEVFLRDYN